MNIDQVVRRRTDSDWDMDVRVRSVFLLRFGFCNARIAISRRRV